MSVRSLEIQIVGMAREKLNNPKIRLKDLQEWSSAPIEPREGEVSLEVEKNLFAAFPASCDKRVKS